MVHGHGVEVSGTMNGSRTSAAKAICLHRFQNITLHASQKIPGGCRPAMEMRSLWMLRGSLN